MRGLLRTAGKHRASNVNKQHRHIESTAALLLLGTIALGGCGPKPTSVAREEGSPQGDTWESIKRLPDWSGVWVLYLEGGAKEASEDSFGTDSGRVPLTPKYADLRAAARASRAQNNLSNCLPAGTPGVLQHGFLHEYLFTPGRVTLLVEDGEVRRIYTDGRPHVSLDELRDSYMGDSIGRWEGSTLVVDTIGFPKGSLFQNHGLLATKASHLVERIFRKDQEHIEIDSTLTDPEIFSRPYTYPRVYQRSELPLTEPKCAQNNRDNGETIDLTPPPEG
jgi:hypothetical protein